MKKLAERARGLAKRAERIYEDWGICPPEKESEFQDITVDYDISWWIRSCENFFEFASMPNYLSAFRSIVGEGHWGDEEQNKYRLIRAAGIMASAAEDLEKGFIGNIKYLVHADFFDSITEQAEALYNAGHIIPAAVLGRIIIEKWIRDFAEKEGIPIEEKDWIKELNNKLLDAQKITEAKYKQIRDHYFTGNFAAHGEEDKFTKEDVKAMLEFVKANCI